MRRFSSPALIAAVVVLAAASALLFMRYRDETQQFAKLKTSDQDTQSRYSQTLDAIASIQDSLNSIALGDTNVTMRGDLKTEQSMNGPSGQEALDRIAALRASIARSKQRIRQLESSLKASGNKVAGLEKLVANLKQSVAEKEQAVAELSSRVENLSTQVAGLQNTVQENEQTLRAREQTIEDKRKENATIYYVVGSKQELTKAGAVVATGGVLGMGKTLQPSSAVKDSALTPLDTDENTVVPIGTAKAKVISAQPASSYQLSPASDGKLELHIVDPKTFRQVKTLVIMTA
jgi:uncharacterized protein (DUF3084 family)